MATIRDGKISTTFNYNKIKAVPELDLPALVRPHSGGAPSVSSISTSIRSESRKIRREEPCFITKGYAYSLEKAHFVNAVRRDENLEADVELFLQGLGIVEDRFSLNSACNLAPLHRDLHYTLDRHGFFAITCSKTSLKAMMVEVDKENTKWQEMATRRRQYIRTFFLDSPPFSDVEYEMVVMNPHHFLPKGTGFLVHNGMEADRLSHKVYVVAPDGALRAGGRNQDERLPPFTGPRARAPADTLNPFLVVINAEMAFRRFKRNPHALYKEYEELIDLTIELVQKIYFQPLVNRIEEEIEKIRTGRIAAVQGAKDAQGDVRMGGVDEFGATSSNDADKTITRKDAGRFSRTGRVVEKPNPGAPHHEVIEYHQYLMSGRDHDFTQDDEDLLAELSSRSDSSEDDVEDAVGIAEKIHQWQNSSSVATQIADFSV